MNASRTLLPAMFRSACALLLLTLAC
ncbi:DUF2490 domain-containing protein, partial [Xanthomonas perforans]